MKPIIVFVLAVSVVACSGPFAGESGLATLQRERSAWKGRAVRAYSYDYQQSCFCPAEIVEPVRIEVRSDTVNRVTSRRTQADLPLKRAFGGGWPTVDSLFAVTERLYLAGQYEVVIEYDGTYRFPTRLDADIPRTADAGLSIRATNFVKAP